MLQDIYLHNDNITKLIFDIFDPLNNQHILEKIINKTITKVILSILSYKKMFKSIGKNQIILRGHDNWVRLLISLSENLILSATVDKTLRIWDIDNYTCIVTIVEDTYISSLLKLPDGNIAVACANSINIRNVNDTLKCIKSIFCEGYTKFNNLTLLTDSRIAFTAYKSDELNSIIISDINANYNIIKVVEAADDDYIFRLTSRSNILASSLYYDFTIKIWNINENSDIKLISQLTGHIDVIIALLFTKERLLLSGSRDETIRVWNLEDYQCVKIIYHEWAYVMLLLPNGFFASSSGNIYDLNDFKCVNTLVRHEHVISSMLFIKGNRIATGSRDKTIILWVY
jgi:WD40 repeat protein